MDQTAVQNDAGTGRLGVGLCPGSGSVTGRGRGGGQHLGHGGQCCCHEWRGEETQCWPQQVMKALCGILGPFRKTWESFGKVWPYNNNSRHTCIHTGFSGGSVVKNLLANAGDTGSIPELEEPLEEEMTTHSSILA